MLISEAKLLLSPGACASAALGTIWGSVAHVDRMETMFSVPHGKSTWSLDDVEQRQAITLHSSKFLTHRPSRPMHLVSSVVICVEAIVTTTIVCLQGHFAGLVAYGDALGGERGCGFC